MSHGGAPRPQRPDQGNAPPAPRPAAVRGNDWRQVALPAAQRFAPSLAVSVVVPYFEAPGPLSLTLAGLERQTYPRELFEVVVVDDGSREPLVAPATPLDLRVVREERRGFGLARARNAGARAAAHGILVFLDCDVIAEAGLIAAHARWHHAVSDALTLGFCAYVSSAGVDAAAVRRRQGSLAALFAGRPFDPPWIERHMARTADLTSDHEDHFRAVTGHNVGIARVLFEEAGGFDESFTRYGGEDTEFGYRVQMRGGLLVPVRDACGWHQGRWAAGRARKSRDQELQAAKLAQLIPDPGFRRSALGRTYAVPRYAVTVEAGDAPEAQVLETARTLLADPAGDLAVRIEMPPGRGDGAPEGVETALRPDPRVQVARAGTALDAFPVSPFHLSVPAGATVRPGLVRELAAALGGAATARVVLGDGARVVIARAWTLHRARRAGGSAADYGGARTLPAWRVLFRSFGRFFPAGSRGARPRPLRGVRAALARVLAEARHVRGLRTGWRFARWLAGGLRWWLRQRRTVAADREAKTAAAPSDPPLGAEIAALGERARAVFRASSRVAHRLDARRVDVVLADTRADAAGVAAPTVVLAEAPALAVPAFDPALHNPVGWVREVEPRVAALGPSDLLPAGVRVHRTVAPGDREAHAHCHHVEDVAAFHRSAPERAGTLARLAACGVLVHLADCDVGLCPLLGAELHRLMTAPIRGADAGKREALSIAMRRASLRAHSLRARARQVCGAAPADSPNWALVSVLLASRRPRRLAAAVANVARQRYPNLELVLALHGPGFVPQLVERATSGFPYPLKVRRLDTGLVLGSVLNAAASAASGALLAKMDDDDLYGPEHLWDLVLAQEYSGARLVGKFPATVYLARLDCTVRRRRVRSETWSRSITGGAMLVARDALERAGGWRPVPRHVDKALVEDVLRAGGAVYRTHDAGYLLVRHGDRHTWEADDAEFLVQAEAVRPGWHPALAGIEETHGRSRRAGAGTAAALGVRAAGERGVP